MDVCGRVQLDLQVRLSHRGESGTVDQPPERKQAFNYACVFAFHERLVKPIWRKSSPWKQCHQGTIRQLFNGELCVGKARW